MGKIHAENRISRLHQGEIRGNVCRRTRERLHIGIAAAEEFFHPLDGNGLNDICKLLPAIITLLWISFRIFIGQYRAVGFQNGPRHIIF